MEEIKAIVYTSNSGHTKQYAGLLSEETGLPIYELKKAKKVLTKSDSVIYLGWLMAGQVKGCKKALKEYDVKAICGVGMAATGSQIDDIRKQNPIPTELPVFTVQGGFEIEKVHGIYKMMMKTMINTVGKKLQQKENRTPEEEATLKLFTQNENLVNKEFLRDLLEWYRG